MSNRLERIRSKFLRDAKARREMRRQQRLDDPNRHITGDYERATIELTLAHHDLMSGLAHEARWMLREIDRLNESEPK